MFSEYKEDFVTSMKVNYYRWLLGICGGFALCLTIYLVFYGPFKGELERLGALVFNVMSVFFSLFVVLLTMRVKIGNSILGWLGTNLFPLYIYQQLSMMVLTELYPNALVVLHPYLFLMACVTITCLITWGYKWICVKIV